MGSRVRAIVLCGYALGIWGCSGPEERAGLERVDLHGNLVLPGFQVRVRDVHPLEDSILVALDSRETVDSETEQQVALVDETERMEILARSPIDRTSARVSAPQSGGFLLSVSNGSPDSTFESVDVVHATASSTATRPHFSLPEPALNLPLRQALLEDREGSVWVLWVDHAFVLRLTCRQLDGGTTDEALAMRIVADLSSALAPWPGGIAVVFAIEAKDDDSLGRFGLRRPHDGVRTIVLAAFERAGHLVDAHVLALPGSPSLGALRLDGESLWVTGTVSEDRNSDEVFVSIWRPGETGGLKEQRTEVLELGGKEGKKRTGDILPLADGRVLLTGEEGFEQATTGSITVGSQGFLYLLSSDLRDVEGLLRFGDGVRRNLGVRLLAWKSRLWLFSHHDHPKTHDGDGSAEEGYGRASLAEIRIEGCSTCVPR